MSVDIEAQQRQHEARVAFDIERRIKAAISDGRDALWRLAEALYEFDEAHGWLKLGHENLNQWLADADVTISRGTYYRYVRTWRKLVVEKQIEPERIRLLDQSKVAIVADKIASDEVLVDDALNDVESLGAQDLREKYYGKSEEPASNVGQSDEEEPESEPEPDPVEPVRADEIDLTSDEPLESVAGVVEVEVVEYEFPGWVTPGAVTQAVQDLRSAADSGASFPRVSRASAQIAEQLCIAWLSTRQS